MDFHKCQTKMTPNLDVQMELQHLLCQQLQLLVQEVLWPVHLPRVHG